MAGIRRRLGSLLGPVGPAGTDAANARFNSLVPKVGTRLTEGQDLNDLSAGVYFQSITSGASLDLNYPAPIAGTLYQHSWGNGRIQIYYPGLGTPEHNRKFFMRSGGPTVWQEWMEFLPSESLDNRYEDKGVSVPKVGVRLSEDDDLNSLPGPGVYFQTSNAQASTALNYPAPIAGTIYQLSWGNGSSQLYIPGVGSSDHNRKLYMRARTGATWQPWLELLSSAEADRRYLLKEDVAPSVTAQFEDVLLPQAIPVEPALSFQSTAYGLEPVARGVDGYVYLKLGGGRIARSNNGLESYEVSTQQWDGKSVFWISRVAEGYAALIRVDTETTELWFAPGDDWNTGWTLAQTIGPCGLLSFPIPAQRRGGGTVLLVSEYTGASQGLTLKLWMSLDGGASWNAIRGSRVVDPSINSHWHGAIFDPIRERIWAAQGDGPNSWFGYSDDLGNTWIGCPTPLDSPIYDGSEYQQPTALIDFRDYVALSPDRGPFTPGMWQMDAETGETIERGTVPGLEGLNADHQYGVGSVRAQRGKEAYVAFPDTGSGNRKTYFLATGDAGRSWHLVHTYEWDEAGAASTGIAGPDEAGYLYFKPNGGGCRVAKTLAWKYVNP